MTTTEIIAVVSVAAVVLGIIVAMRIAAKRRRQDLERLAGDLGLEFAADGAARVADLRAKGRLFDQGRHRRLSNMMTGHIEDLEIFIFDYKYTTSSGENANRHVQTVVAIRLAGETFAEFELRPENVFHKIGSAMGYQDIDLEAHPEFSKKFLLRGPDEAAIRAAFNDDVVEVLASAKRLCVESCGDWLIVYRAGKTVPPADVPDFLEQAFTICNRLTSRA